MIPGDPGAFSERLGLLPPVATADALGGRRVSDGPAVTVWARFERGNAGDSVEARRPASDTTIELTIRRRPENLTGWGANWRGVRYRIAAIRERAERELLGLVLEGGTAQ